MAEQGAPVQPRSGNDLAMLDIKQPEPSIVPLRNGTVTSKPGNGQMADEAADSGNTQEAKAIINTSGEGSRSVMSDFEFLWRLRKYLLFLAVLAVSVTYNAGLSPPGGFQMDNSLHHNAVAGDPLLPVTFFRRYEAFFYCNATAFAASLILIILLLSRGVASKRVWLRSMQVTMILDLFSLMGAYAAGSCRATRSSVFILVLVCAVFIYVGVHIIVFINQMLSICHVPHIDAQTNCQNEQKEIEEARKFILMLATFAATITYQAGMSPPGGFWGANGHGYRPGTFVLRRHNLLRFDIFTCCNATSFVASLVTVILLLSRGLSTHGIRTRALYVCVIVDLLGLIGAYASGCSRNVGTSLAVILIIVVVLICVLFLVMFLQSETATLWKNEGVKPAFNQLLRMLSWRQDSHLSNSKQNDSQSTLQHSNLQCYPVVSNPISTADVRSAASASDPNTMSNALNQPHDRSDKAAMETVCASLKDAITTEEVSTYSIEVQSAGSQQVAIPMGSSLPSDSGKSIEGILPSLGSAYHNAASGDLRIDTNDIEDLLLKKSRTYLLFLAILAVSLTYQAGLNPPGGFWTSNATNHLAGDPILHDGYHKRYLSFFYLNATAFAASLLMILMLLSKKMSNRVIKRRALQTAMITDLLALTWAFVAGSCREKTKTLWTSLVIFPVVAYVFLHVLVSGYIIPGWRRIKKAPPESAGTYNKLREANEKDLEQRRNLLFVLAILAATVTYQAGLNPPGGIWPDGSTNGKPGNPTLQDSHPKRYDVFYYSNAVSFVSSVAVIILLVNRESCVQGIKSYALRVCLIAGLLALLVAYSAGSCRKLKSVIYLIVIAAAVLVCLVIQVLVLSTTQGGPLTWLRSWLRTILHLVTDSEKSTADAKMQSNPPDDANKQSDIEKSSDDAIMQSNPPYDANKQSDTDKSSDDANRQSNDQYIDEKNKRRRQKYLMLLAILAASIAYQAGLNPPGGFWSDDTSDGYKAGNPVLKDIHSMRYMVFFVSNSISFMSSIPIVMLLLSKSVRKKNIPLQALHFIMILALLALLTAYAAGSCRKFKTSIFVLVVVCCVLVYLLIVIILSSGIARWLKERNERKGASLLGMS